MVLAGLLLDETRLCITNITSSLCSTVRALEFGLGPGTLHFHQNPIFLIPGFSDVGGMRTT